MNSPGTLNVGSASNGTGITSSSSYAELGQFEDPNAVNNQHDLASSVYTKMTSLWGRASTLMRMIGVVLLLVIVCWMPMWLRLFVCGLILMLWQVHCRKRAREKRREVIIQRELRRMDLERQEAELMVHQAARRMLELDRNHLEDFVIKNPSGTYEEWIGQLHPDNFHEGVLDHRFYVEDSDHRKLWNDSLAGSVREFVPAKSGGGIT
jgi:hypothetical protein